MRQLKREIVISTEEFGVVELEIELTGGGEFILYSATKLCPFDTVNYDPIEDDKTLDFIVSKYETKIMLKGYNL
jgi:hypothetical protein